MADVAATLAQGRVDLAAALRMADRLGFGEGVCNHFSLMVGDDRFLLNPNRVHWSEITASSLVLVDGGGNLVAGEEPPEPTAFYIHWRMHAAAPQARCILHTHMPYATALTMLHEPNLLPLSQSSLMFYGKVAYDLHYNGLAVDRTEGDGLAAALGNRNILFLSNHGVVVTGQSVAEAFNRLYYLERAAMHQVMAMSTGQRLRLVPRDVAEATCRQLAEDEADMAAHHFAGVRRLLDRECPGWRD